MKRPRFSVRTLAIVVTLVCLYGACWGPTKTRAVGEVTPMQVCTITRSAVVPLVVGIDEMDGKRRYYFWFFGYVAKLPYEHKLSRYSQVSPLPSQ